MTGTNKFLLAVMLAAGGYQAWGSYRTKLFPVQPLYQKPYIVVYGRETCGNCQALRKGLDSQSVPYVWKIIDEAPNGQEVYPRMKEAGLDTSRFSLPVVDVNAEMLIHPETAAVVEKYRAIAKPAG